ncbi:MAG: pilus assembly protein N-terminal domain-containing protein [Deltaproteobacteria bacterium]|nr:pilus assembly protein N-terminal domain-containing protein [Deltaproteobacteria bacterium]
MFSLIALSAYVQAAEETVPDQVVVINSQVAIDVPYAFGDISVGSGEVVKVVPLRDEKQLLLAGREVGTTNVILFDTRGVRRDEFEVTVIPANLAKVMKNVQVLLDDIEGLSFKIVNDRIYIQGEVSLDDELRRVQDLDEKENLVESMVTLSPVSQRLLASLIQKEIGTPGVNVRLVGRKIMLEGTVHSDAASARAEAIAKAYYPDVVNVLEIREVERVPGQAETIVLVVHFVELTKTLTDEWGIQWTPLSGTGVEFELSSSNDGSGWSDVTGTATANVSMLLPRLEALRSTGYVRVLENPTVSVKSGDTAHIFSGSKVPIVYLDNGTKVVEFIDVGITLDVTPYAAGASVDLNIGVEVSALGEVAANGYQSVDLSEISTSQFCRAGESIVIGGLERLSDRVNYNKLPSGLDLNAEGIFTLYRSKDYKKSKSQFLVFITPQIHESSSTANREIQDKFNLLEVRQ